METDNEIIFQYTRRQALTDGVLVDVTATARSAGFRIPVALTANLQARLTPHDFEQSRGQSYAGRLWDCLWLAAWAARTSPGRQRGFSMGLSEQSEQQPDRMEMRIVSLWICIGPDDEGAPVITIGFPEDF